MDWWKDLIQKLNKFATQRFHQLFHKNKAEASEEAQPSDAVVVLKKRVRMQAITALASVALIMVLVFAMTAAWYTNVAKTSDLTFKAETWGYDADKIQVGDITIAVAPGNEGFIPLSVDNSDSTEGVRIGVTISELETDQEWQTELRKRIFFFADTGRTYEFPAEEGLQNSDGDEAAQETTYQETVSRVYIGATEENGYSYTVLPGQKLHLEETYYNDVPIKWMWVYDMLGYYFRGSVVSAQEDPDSEASAMIVEEYLRPIEFDYPSAVYDREEFLPDSETLNQEYGQLQTADGLSRTAFLEKISLSDGYRGTINAEEPVIIPNEETNQAGYYYPVDVDEKGYGVWAYLCTSAEVEDGIDFDNQIAEQEGGLSMTATINLTAVALPAVAEEVSSTEALITALANTEVGVISLTSELALAEPLALSGNVAKVIDLNNYNLAYTGQGNMFELSQGASLTVMNGVLYPRGGENIYAFETKGADLTLSNVILTGFNQAVDFNDSAEGVEQNSTVRLSGCTVDTSDVCIMIRGNGMADETTTKVIVENSRLTSEYIALCGQGNSENWGTEIVVIGSDVTGKWGALYQPQGSSSTIITDSVLSGYTGIAVKGGVVTVNNSTITGTGEYGEPKEAKSGYTDTGDAVYVEAVYNWSATVILKGDQNKIISENAYAVDLFGQPGKGPGRVMLYGGSYKGGSSSTGGSVLWNGVGNFEIHGGDFSGKQEFPEETPITRYDQ